MLAAGFHSSLHVVGDDVQGTVMTVMMVTKVTIYYIILLLVLISSINIYLQFIQTAQIG